MDCRAAQADALRDLLAGDAHHAAVGVHGPPGTGKSPVLRSFLQSNTIPFSWVQCDQCLTSRILLQRALRQIFAATGCGAPEDAVCENVDAFVSLLQDRLTAKHVLVLDRIDRLPDYRATVDLFNCLVRLPEIAPRLTGLVVVFVYSTAEPKVLVANPAMPRVWFPRFTPEEALDLLQRDLPGAGSQFSLEFQKEFVDVVYQALVPHTGTDVAQLRRAIERIWPEFVRDAQPGDTVAKLYVRNPQLFASEGMADTLAAKGLNPASAALRVSPTASLLLAAAYLASYNSPRYDMRYFSLAKGMRNRRRETRPKKAATIPVRSLPPPAFEMERLLAIFHAVHDDAFAYQPDVDVGRELATLAAQNLLVRTQSDPLDSRTKWKVNAPWGYVQRLAAAIDFNIEDYLVEE